MLKGWMLLWWFVRLLCHDCFSSADLCLRITAAQHQSQATLTGNGAQYNPCWCRGNQSNSKDEGMGITNHWYCGATVTLHVNIYDTMRSQTGRQQFQSRLLSSLQSTTQYKQSYSLSWRQSVYLTVHSGEEWRWHWCHLAGIHNRRYPLLCLSMQGRCREKEVERLGAPGIDPISR